MPDLRQVRLLLDHRQVLRKICKISFTANDASIYVIPYASERRFYYGGRNMPEATLEDTFDFTAGIAAGREPHLSIHETGCVRMYAQGEPVAGPLQIPHLATLRGEHVASVTADTFDALAVHGDPPRTSGSEIDHVIPADDAVESGCLAVYVNGLEPEFSGGRCRLTFSLQRPSLQNLLHVGVKVISQASLSTGPGRGISVIAGWDPSRPEGAEQDYL